MWNMFKVNNKKTRILSENQVNELVFSPEITHEILAATTRESYSNFTWNYQIDVLKTFIKSFEAPQTSVKIKIKLTLSLCPG